MSDKRIRVNPFGSLRLYRFAPAGRVHLWLKPSRGSGGRALCGRDTTWRLYRHAARVTRDQVCSDCLIASQDIGAVSS